MTNRTPIYVNSSGVLTNMSAGSDTVPVTLGGTGAITASGALSNLGGASLTSNNVFTGTNIFNNTTVITTNATQSTPQSSGDIFSIIGQDGVAVGFEIQCYNNGLLVNGGSFRFYSANGTAASPTALNTGNILVNIAGLGYTGSAYSRAVRFQGVATQTWSSSAAGSSISLETTKNGTIASAQSFLLDQDGSLKVGYSVLTAVTANNSLKVPVSTVAGLPSASTEGTGAIRAVNDALAPSIGVAVVGGGSVYCLVSSNGTSWIA